MSTLDQHADHTPGPWKVSRAGRSVLAGGIKINQSSGPCAASVSVQNRIDAELRANARLIAAAPDMLRLIRDIYAGIHMGQGRFASASDGEIADAINDTMCNLFGNGWRS